jgi:hypothetical protein
MATQLLNGESLIGLGEAARSLPGSRTNPTMCPTTILRWINRGARARDGQLVRLEAVRIGSRWFTSHEALARFSERLGGVSTNDGSDETPIRSPASQDRASKKAAAALEARGA